jgi:hypothetical protein
MGGRRRAEPDGNRAYSPAEAVLEIASMQVSEQAALEAVSSK